MAQRYRITDSVSTSTDPHVYHQSQSFDAEAPEVLHQPIKQEWQEIDTDSQIWRPGQDGVRQGYADIAEGRRHETTWKSLQNQALIKVETGHKRAPGSVEGNSERAEKQKTKKRSAEQFLDDASKEGPQLVPIDGQYYGSPSPVIIECAGEDAPEERVQHGDPVVDQDQQSFPTATSHPTMSPQERTWWAMTFEDLYQFAKREKFGNKRYVRRHSGRTRIIQWLCEKEGIIPYAATRSAPFNEAKSKTIVRESGAIAHPESILTTSDPALQRLIDGAEQKYRLWTSAQLHELSMQRSYQLLKDSNGKLPSKSVKAMAKWLAAWDVLKSPREKKWWLGDGIDLVNRAKAMGYSGPSRKYEVILWLRTTPEDSEIEVAEPTPNKSSTKPMAGDKGPPVSKRRAKGSTRSPGWL